MDRRAQDSGESSNLREIQSFWKELWNWKCPPMLKNFLWKLGSNILATRENLFRKGFVKDPYCPFCLTNTETAFHALWSCPASVAIWQDCGRRVQKMVLEECEGIQFIKSFEERLASYEL
jgi:hypothetical protein